MKSSEHKDLVNAVLASRDDIDPELESGLLEAIVGAETISGGDGDAAMRAIDAAVTAAIERDVGAVQGASPSETAEDKANGASEYLEDGG